MNASARNAVAFIGDDSMRTSSFLAALLLALASIVHAQDSAGVPAKIKSVVDPAAFYPPGAKSRGERGAPVVQACVDSTGKLSREPVITDTSGFPDLDAAALKVAKANRYKPGTENGAPLPESCIKYRVKFG